MERWLDRRSVGEGDKLLGADVENHEFAVAHVREVGGKALKQLSDDGAGAEVLATFGCTAALILCERTKIILGGLTCTLLALLCKPGNQW